MTDSDPYMPLLKRVGDTIIGSNGNIYYQIKIKFTKPT